MLTVLDTTCFNGATTFQPWKPAPGNDAILRLFVMASMGPRPFSRGNLRT